MNAQHGPGKQTRSDDDTQPVNPAYVTEDDAPSEGPRSHEQYHDSAHRGENRQKSAEMDEGDDPAEGARDVGAPAAETVREEGAELEPVQDTPQGATEDMTVRSDEAGDLPDEKVNPMNLPDSAMPSEIAPTSGTDTGAQGDVPTQDNTGGRWNVDQIAPAPPETEDIQDAFNSAPESGDSRSEVF
jgi:hypothetical protein